MKNNLRKILIISIFIICIISIIFAVSVQIKANKQSDIKIETVLEEDIIDKQELKENFSKIFDNRINYQGNISNADKKEQTQELVHTKYLNQDEIEEKYKLDVNIPSLNVKTEIADSINKEIESLFYNKLVDIISNGSKSIYSVSYTAYVNDEILSLIIKATLKEGDKPQREIIKTYNYNLVSNQKLDINKIIEYKKLSSSEVQKEINDTINLASENAKVYSNLGYNKYERNPKDAMYRIENTNAYFLGENKVLYIIYSYGNLNYTSELDLVVM